MQPLTLMLVSSARVASSEASRKTIKKRLQQIQDTRDTVGIGLEDEVQALPKEKRQQLLREVGLPIEIPAPHVLAMKTSLSISWNKLTTLRRYTKTHIKLILHSIFVGG